MGRKLSQKQWQKGKEFQVILYPLFLWYDYEKKKLETEIGYRKYNYIGVSIYNIVEDSVLVKRPELRKEDKLWKVNLYYKFF